VGTVYSRALKGVPMPTRPVTPQVERRREQRRPVHEEVHLHVLNPLSDEILIVCMVDRSTDGLSITTVRPLSVGTLVQLRLKDALILGEVRYCVRSEVDFKIGVRIESSMRLSRSEDGQPARVLRRGRSWIDSRHADGMRLRIRLGQMNTLSRLHVGISKYARLPSTSLERVFRERKPPRPKLTSRV
jgi:hypothetical protein